MFLYSMLLYKIFKLHLLASYELKKRKWRYLFVPMHEGCAGVGRQGMCLIGLYLHGVVPSGSQSCRDNSVFKARSGMFLQCNCSKFIHGVLLLN